MPLESERGLESIDAILFQLLFVYIIRLQTAPFTKFSVFKIAEGRIQARRRDAALYFVVIFLYIRASLPGHKLISY